jgi:hypothetical protein
VTHYSDANSLLECDDERAAEFAVADKKNKNKNKNKKNNNKKKKKKKKMKKKKRRGS